MIKRTLAACVAAATLSTAAQAADVEVLHYWTSGGEAKSVAYLKEKLTEAGVGWKDFAVAGGGGENAMTVLKSRAVSGNPPTAAQIKGPSIQEWGELGFLSDIDSVAKANNWDALLPGVVSDVMKHDGKYVAAPVNVHRVNWLWANPEIFQKAGATIPTTWDDFLVQAKKIQDAGYIALAHGGQAWQDATVFEAVVLGVGGPEYYQKAFVELDADALNSATTEEVFRVFGEIRGLIDENSPGRDWNVATSMVINGEAAMQIMGDWAKGEFTVAGKTPGVDYACVAAPGTSGSFTFNVDSFAFFAQSDADAQKAQQEMAKQILGQDFQKVFNLNKGSIPARLGMARDEFDSCAHASMDAFVSSAQTGGLVPSFAHGMAVPEAVSGAIYDTATNFFNSDQSAAEGKAQLIASIQAAM
ncbi:MULTISPECIES: ABC transporter substrate-binding protein [unclassified Marinobacterium]|jgi:glucose/mannose transport system substrate-binding protein|uniref:ABC transporter substrate-binding protein n=1 Tax=unclassified Marinobacterium TaxID=2644139 RepID=UPI0015693E59|nr:MULTISPECIES: ABC transporter substrate-binding protein [unclassified Marinobacterium]NRP09071.1 putative sugar-binding periplasmic protein precursor [Marinobacterium sp. xm-g-48]NRP15075.1 putative sugar-binding periplasmic protein precursor [Marinobacterium sp. xm-a-152]NRP27947.1 putative sugar-binding periplasmic protein precursor [Marinobacterium sp. xm-d-420]NRP35822.1 putative sugar-binding periplasmic protein precursor [Marinobacterium sp. xm-d-579]NRP39524.1 putative sugar-binding 